MKTHVINPYTRSPSLMLNLTVEETQQVVAGVKHLLSQPLRAGDLPGCFTGNMQAAIYDLLGNLQHALETPRPGGLKGVTP